MNKVLQKAWKRSNTHFSQFKYTTSRKVSALFIEKANIRLLIFRLLNVLIEAAKIVDIVIIGVKGLEYW